LEHLFHVGVCRNAVPVSDGLSTFRDSVTYRGQACAFNLTAAEECCVSLRDASAANQSYAYHFAFTSNALLTGVA
jgi:hypothetical protein